MFGHVRCYLLGRIVTVLTDHHSLCWMMSIQTPKSRFMRWALKLQEFDLRIIHKGGKAHTYGDCLSLFPVKNGVVNVLSTLKEAHDKDLEDKWADVPPFQEYDIKA